VKTRLIEANLLAVLSEIRNQPEVGATFPDDLQSYAEFIEQTREYIEDVGEYGIAYQSLVSTLEGFPFLLSGLAAVKLLEVGLLMKFKTELPEDKLFDNR
jgi:hypothetical protein